MTGHLTSFFGHGPSFDHPTSFGPFFGLGFRVLLMVWDSLGGWVFLLNPKL